MNYMDDDSEMPAEAQSATPESSGGGDMKTALVNSDLCPGMKPGDEFTVRVERVLDSGEYELSYPGEHESTEEPMPESEPAPEMDYMG